MPAIGVDCQIIVDGHGYFVEPGSYGMVRARNASASAVAGAGATLAGTLSGQTSVTVDDDGNGRVVDIMCVVPFHTLPTVTLTPVDTGPLGSGTIAVSGLALDRFSIVVSNAEADATITVNWLAAPADTAVLAALPENQPPVGGSPTRIVDRGPGMRVWKMTILCANNLHRYDGTPMGAIGQKLREQLTHSYDRVATILGFTDPLGVFYHVLFSGYAERLDDPRTQMTGITMRAMIQLTEAA